MRSCGDSWEKKKETVIVDEKGSEIIFSAVGNFGKPMRVSDEHVLWVLGELSGPIIF